ncbi:MAG: hypothetical protein ACP5JS_06970 [Fervidobacterium sp.]
MKSDRDFFKKFPAKDLVLLIFGIILMIINFDFLAQIKYVRDFYLLIIFVKNTIAALLIIYSFVIIIMYFVKRTSTKTFLSNLEEVRKDFIAYITKNEKTLIADFVSFRPWMAEEFYVKSVRSVPSIFIPLYLVAFALKDNKLYITEAKVDVMNKEFQITGYYTYATTDLISTNLSQDRIMFSSSLGENVGATVEFIEINTNAGITKIPLFEEELLSSFGNVKPLRNEFIQKVSMVISVLNRN